MDSEWLDIRKEAMNILLEENRLEQIVKLVCPDALPVEERFILFCSELIKNGFLQQNSFDPKDMYCSPEKQIKILGTIIMYYRMGKDLIGKGVTLDGITSLKNIPELSRLKSEVSNEEVKKIDLYWQQLKSEIESLKFDVSYQTSRDGV